MLGKKPVVLFARVFALSWTIVSLGEERRKFWREMTKKNSQSRITSPRFQEDSLPRISNSFVHA